MFSLFPPYALAFFGFMGIAGALSPPDGPIASGPPANPNHFYFPSDYARDQSFSRVSEKPTTILDVRFLTDELTGEPELLTVGPVKLGNGWTLGADCAEHVRVGDTITSGIVRNAEKNAIVMTLGAGDRVVLPADFCLYVGPYRHRPYGLKSEVTHCLKCWCNCEGEDVIFDCPDCAGTGNQCSDSNGTECEKADGSWGTTSSCHEVLVRCEGGAPGQR